MVTRRLHLVIAATMTASVPALVQDTSAQPPQDGGPIVIGERKYPWKAFDLRRFDAAIDVLSRWRSDRLRREGTPDVVDTELLLREVLDLSGEASIGHKNLMDLRGSVRFGLEDRFLDSDTFGAEDHSSDFTNLFDVSATLFGASRVPFDIYARREEQFLDRDFSTSLRNLTFETGAVAQIQSARAPTTIRAFHLENDQSDQLGEFDYGRDQNTVSIQSNLLIADNHRLVAEYTFDDIIETQGTTFENAYQRHDVLLSDTLNFGERKRHEIRSYLRYYNQTGDFGLERIRLDEQLVLAHDRTFETRYNGSIERLTRAGVDQDTARLSASLRHQLFESLTTTASAGGQWLTTSTDFTSTQWFVQGQTDYTKRVPMGRLGATLGGSFTAVHNGEQGGTISVIDEAHVFRDPFPITISRRNIVVGSIVITAQGGTPTYQEGFDYTVDYFQDRAEIRVVIGRGISDGQTILIDYDVGPEPANDIDTVGLTVSLRYTVNDGALRGLSLYSTYRRFDHTLDAPDPSRFVLDDTADLTIGVEYARWGMRLRAERLDHQSTVNPYESLRFWASYDHVFSRGSAVGVDAVHEIIEYENPVNEVAFSRATVRWTERWGRDLELVLRLDLRDENDDLRGDSQGVEQSLTVRWRRRQTRVYAIVRNTLLDSGDTDRSSQFLEFGFRRDF